MATDTTAQNAGASKLDALAVTRKGRFDLYAVLRTMVIVCWVLVAVAFFRPAFLHGPAGYVMVSGTSMEPTFHDRDFLITQRRDEYHVGDVIAYRVPKGSPAAGAMVVHRIVGGSAAHGFVTQGDNRNFADVWHPKPGDIVGKVKLKVPVIGHVMGSLKTIPGLSIVGGLTAFLLLWPTKPEDSHADADEGEEGDDEDGDGGHEPADTSMAAAGEVPLSWRAPTIA